MLPYYAYKRYKENQALKEAALDKKDEQFLAEVVEQSPPPPEPSTPATTVDSLFEESKTDWNKEKEKKTEPWGQTIKRWGTFGRASSSNSVSKKGSAQPTPSSSQPQTPSELPKPVVQEPVAAANDSTTPEPELTKEQRDLAEVLDSLDMQAGSQGIAFTTPDTRALLQQFTQIIKDIITGVPTAYNDLIEFLESSSTQLSKEWNSLPSSFQKLIRSLPLGIPPDVFASMTAGAAAAVPTAAADSAPKASTGFASKLNPMSMFTKTNPTTGAKSHTLPSPGKIKDLLGTGGGIATIFRSIITFLKTRFPMLAGTNALMSMGLSILMLLLWYCYKRGREVRLQKEAEAAALEAKDAPEIVKDTPNGEPSANPDPKGV
ncbi:unnamed protein product [Rhizoctonia solani]|uniref:Transmembrane protein n=1 Tax=Rhizoctonia solani TaxID=456999 RepID=A0A8H3EAG4_9AGAM|nr:unnamed protein product [Rhizoctonia solani]